MTSIEAPPPVPYNDELVLESSLRRGESHTLRWRELALLVTAALMFDISLRTGLHNAATVLGVGAVGAMMLAGGRLWQPSSRYLVLGALTLSPFLWLRASAGLTAATIVAIAGLLALAAGLSREGRFFDLEVRAVVAHIAAQSIEWTYGLGMARELTSAESGSRRGELLRGVLVALPIVVVFAVLLASADAVFSHLLLIGDIPSLVGHVILTLTISVVLLGLASRAAYRTAPFEGVDIRRPLGAVELTTILGSVALLFTAFVGTQIGVALGGADHVLLTENLTQAEHARQGFFQLLWVSALTLIVLGSLRALRSGPEASDRFRPLALVVLALTLVITIISIQRLSHYVGAFGLTPLRLWSIAAAGWIGLIIVGYMMSIGGIRRDTSWFPGFAIMGAAAFVASMNIANRDAFVTRYNMTNQRSDQLDTVALAQLSDDAVPVAIDLMVELDPVDRASLIRGLCQRYDLDRGYGLLGANRAERQADQLLDRLCVRARPRPSHAPVTEVGPQG